MDVTLKVLAGAKTGGKIAIKKDKFLIGRSKKCNLCAGSDSVSRRHCAIVRKDTRVFVKDLGSRNGTLLNDKRIEKTVELKSGDELSVGPLRFLITISHGISNLKRSKVKSVADAAARTAESRHGDVQEDEISSWLLGPDPSVAMTETQTIRLDDTNAAEMQQAIEELVAEPTESSNTPTEEDVSATEKEADEPKDKKGKPPGKLPAIPNEPSSKDSREAASKALRSWNRRH